MPLILRRLLSCDWRLPNTLSRETKIGLLVGASFMVVVGLIVPEDAPSPPGAEQHGPNALGKTRSRSAAVGRDETSSVNPTLGKPSRMSLAEHLGQMGFTVTECKVVPDARIAETEPGTDTASDQCVAWPAVPSDVVRYLAVAVAATALATGRTRPDQRLGPLPDASTSTEVDQSVRSWASSRRTS
jgi:hypothetical protein